MSKTVGAATTPYTWDRLGLGGLGQIVADGAGETIFDPAGLQGRISAAGVAQHAHGDGLGSLRLVTNASGAASGSATYEPWGAPRGGSASLGGFGYAGELTDAETGLVYLRARYLDPGTGRFLTEDTYQCTLGAPISQRRFAYGNANPLSYTGPSGHCGVGVDVLDPGYCQGGDATTASGGGGALLLLTYAVAGGIAAWTGHQFGRLWNQLCSSKPLTHDEQILIGRIGEVSGWIKEHPDIKKAAEYKRANNNQKYPAA